MSDFLLDSGILILQLRNHPGYTALLEQLSEQGALFISTITRFEVLQGMKERERKQTIETLEVLESLPVVDDIAEKAGELVRTWRAKGATLGISDVLIAATALQHNLSLVTTNPKHFPMPELILYATDDAGKMTRWTR
jgi:predicted nucleic acid-binding protein